MNVPSGYLPALAVIRLAYSQYGGEDLEALAADMEINPDTEKPMDPAVEDDWMDASAQHGAFDALVAFLKDYASRNQPSDAGMMRFMADLHNDASDIHRVALDALSP